MAAMSTRIARMKVAQSCAAALCLQKKAPTASVKSELGRTTRTGLDWCAAYGVAEQAGEERPQ
jgi:hypothetical protein